MKSLTVILPCLLVLSLAFSPVQAQTAKPVETAQSRLDVRTKELMETLDRNQTSQLQAIRNAQGTIRAVEDVQGSVKRAVTACGEKNPEIKEAMTARYDDWRMALRPTLKKAQSKLEKMILLQSVGKPSEIRAYLKLFDDAVAERNSKITSVPVTEKTECEKLVASMDKTQADLIRLITEQLNLDQDLKQKDL